MSLRLIRSVLLRTLFSLSVLCAAFSCAAAEGAGDDFFAQDPETAQEEKPVSEAPVPAESEIGHDVGSILSGFLGEDKDDDGSSEYNTPIEAVLPRTGLMLARTSAISRLDSSLSELLKNFGFGKLSPIDWVKLSPYGKAFKYVDKTRPLGACWYDVPNGKYPVFALYVPVRHFLPFAEQLGADTASYENDAALSAGTILSVKKPEGWALFHSKGYAVLLKQEKAADVIKGYGNAAPIGDPFYKQTGLKDADFRAVITPYGIHRFTDLRSAAASEVIAFLPEVVNKIKETNPDFNLDLHEISPKAADFSKWVSRNLRQLVLEAKAVSDTVLTSTIFVPDAGLELARHLESQGGVIIPTLLDQPEYLKILPTRFAVLTGQTDIYPDWAKELEPPFDRLRHIEYSLGVPQQNQLLAEASAFFLEVDNTDAFVHELIVPKARKIGAHVGAEQVGQIAGRLLGNLSMNRRARGGRPLFYDSPESAASAGLELGEALGSELGSRLGEEQAMKKYDFEGYTLYVSDMELYIREMREIALEESGQKPQVHPRALLNGEPTLRIALTSILSGLETGSIDEMIRGQVLSGTEPIETPLPVRENLILVLDREHLLIVPGNREILSEAVARWRDFIDRKGKGGDTPSTSDWQKNRDVLYREMANGSSQVLRSTARFNLNAAHAESAYLRHFYNMEALPSFPLPVPADLPAPLFVGTDTHDTEFLYSVFPDAFLKFLLDSARAEQDRKKNEKSK